MRRGGVWCPASDQSQAGGDATAADAVRQPGSRSMPLSAFPRKAWKSAGGVTIPVMKLPGQAASSMAGLGPCRIPAEGVECRPAAVQALLPGQLPRPFAAAAAFAPDVAGRADAAVRVPVRTGARFGACRVRGGRLRRRRACAQQQGGEDRCGPRPARHRGISSEAGFQSAARGAGWRRPCRSAASSRACRGERPGGAGSGSGAVPAFVTCRPLAVTSRPASRSGRGSP